MSTYIILLNWTEKGIQNLKESPARLEAFKKGLQAVGGRMKDFFLVMGRYDMIAIVEAPDDEAMSRVLLQAGTMGNIRTQTLRAFSEDQYRKIIGSLG